MQAGSGVEVGISIRQDVGFGRSLRLVGAGPELGDWQPGQGLDMTWTEGNVWVSSLSLPPGTKLEFKFVKVSGSGLEWEPGSNHVLTAGEGSSEDVALAWGAGGSGAPAQPRPPTAAQGQGEDAHPLRPLWSGKDIVFMRGNEHSSERSGVWLTQGLVGATLALVEGDREAGSWLQKLEVVEKLLVKDAPKLRPGLDAVASSYIYLQWVGNGTLACVESGGHHRPNRHAELARSMFRSLEWVIAEGPGQQGEGGPGLGLLARRLQARLPSFDAAYTASTPLTRIRDIAHRNDIPQDLKQEIKHTIQNKLHRNAGPEDLMATTAMLQRITAQPGQYSASFIHEFTVFHRELTDFFGAGLLTDSLEGVRGSLNGPSETQVLDHFLAAKQKLDGAGGSAGLNDIMDALHPLSTLRALLCSRLASGLRNDASDDVLATRQRWRLAEILAEDYAFVLLSRFGNALDAQGGAEGIASGADGKWALPIGALVLGLRQVGLGSGHELARECAALEQELSTWQRLGGFADRDAALRLKASLQRLRRLNQSYSRTLMDSLSDRAKKLGHALGVSAEIGGVFTEAEIRASVVFQLSKLTATVLKATVRVAGGSPFDVVVGGEAVGKLRAVYTLEPGCLGEEPSILVVRSATGDEEVGALGPNLRGIILRHDIPHLSHLGVRARQENVPFVLVEDDAFFDSDVAGLLDTVVCLNSVPDATTLKSAGEDAGTGPAPASAVAGQRPPQWKGEQPARISSLAPAACVIPLDKAVVGSCGSKAAACSLLSNLAADSGTDAAREFAAPEGVVLPFGTMELAIKEGGEAAAFRKLLDQLDATVRQADSAERNAALSVLCSQAQELITDHAVLPTKASPWAARPHAGAIRALQAALPSGSLVIARSSANVEDLAGLSGAGLYDSIPGIDPSDATSLRRGIAAVWASLFSRRAVLSRGAVGIPSDVAAMAVLLQRQLSPDLSFVLHTAHPVTRDPGTLWAEVAPGQGEILASGTRGAAWCMEVTKGDGALRMLSFANFSAAWLPTPSKPSGNGADPTVQRLSVVDYSTQALSGSVDARKQLAGRLLGVGTALETALGCAQDIEGCLVAGQLWIVQTRPQP